MSEATLVGELTGAEFGYRPGQALQAAGWGERFRGSRLDTGEVVFIHRLDTLSEGFEEDMTRARTAVALAQRPEIQGCPAIVRLIDFRYEPIANGWGDPYDLC